MKTLDVLPTALDIPNDGWEGAGEVGESLGCGLGCGSNFDGAVDGMNGVGMGMIRSLRRTCMFLGFGACKWTISRALIHLSDLSL